MNLLNRLIYHGILIPFSLLPFRILYAISDGVCFLFYRVIGYRKKVVMSNLENSFPDMPLAQRKVIAQKFYHHFCDLVIESLKGFTISDAEVHARNEFVNLEL